MSSSGDNLSLISSKGRSSDVCVDDSGPSLSVGNPDELHSFQGKKSAPKATQERLKAIELHDSSRLNRRSVPTAGPEKDQQVELSRTAEDDPDVEMNGEHQKMKGGKEINELENLLVKYEGMTSVAIPGSIFTTSFIYIVRQAVNGKLVGDVKAGDGLADIFFIFALMSALATWLFVEMWKSDVDAASNENKASASSENKGAANTRSAFEERIRDFSFRYMCLVLMRATYLSCWLLGLFFALSGSSLWNSILSGLTMLVVIGIVIYQIYGAYKSYQSRANPVIVV